MKIIYLLLITCILASCQSNSAKEKQIINRAKSVHKLPTGYKTHNSNRSRDTAATNETADEYATFYVVIADTGQQYFKLKNKMIRLNQSLHISIDTMGRSYNKAKDLIALPDDDEDEIFAGDYFQRRALSDFLSLEYLLAYSADSGKKTIALVAGIYETKASADSVLKIINSTNAFVIKSKIYQGCLH